MVDDNIIETRDLKKVYRLYSSPRQKILDLLGVLKFTNVRVAEHAALDGIDIKIRRGEKVAIIGRNGAGKSTFLKIVCGVTSPTSGEINVPSGMRALLQLDTGFHPDFTGRQNIQAYLAQLGVTSDEADHLVAGITEFSELEEYIDQPVKTYSTGMAMRLVFSTATAVVPDVLVIDEILGVGDSYFMGKSFNRIQTLCESSKTTVLMVSHDLHSTYQLCERTVWIDKGRVIFDGDSMTAIKLYESSVREQEEARLRQRRYRLESRSKADGEREKTLLFGHIRGRAGNPLDNDMAISRIAFLEEDQELAALDVGTDSEDNGIKLITESAEGNWSAPQTLDGQPARMFKAEGSIFHRAPFQIESERIYSAAEKANLDIEITYKDTVSTPCDVEMIFGTGNRRLYGSLGNQGRGAWETTRVPLSLSKPDSGDVPFARYGTQGISITRVAFIGSDGKERHTFGVGDYMSVRLDYEIREEGFDEKPVILIAFLKDGAFLTHRFMLDSIRLSHIDSKAGSIEATAEPILFGPGEYTVNVAVFREGYFDVGAHQKYLTINANVLDDHNRAYHLVVLENPRFKPINETVFFHPVKWRKDGVAIDCPDPDWKFSEGSKNNDVGKPSDPPEPMKS
jgi:lipopolysaccharide transport system ATP-binding protein